MILRAQPATILQLYYRRFNNDPLVSFLVSPCLHSKYHRCRTDFRIDCFWSFLWEIPIVPNLGPGAKCSNSIFFFGSLTPSGLEFDVLLQKYIFCILSLLACTDIWPRALAKYNHKDKFTLWIENQDPAAVSRGINNNLYIYRDSKYKWSTCTIVTESARSRIDCWLWNQTWRIGAAQR